MTDIREIIFNDTLDLDHYLNPVALIICYLIIALTSSILLDPQVIYLICKVLSAKISYASRWSTNILCTFFPLKQIYV
jgi:hypothetical protein